MLKSVILFDNKAFKMEIQQKFTVKTQNDKSS